MWIKYNCVQRLLLTWEVRAHWKWKFWSCFVLFVFLLCFIGMNEVSLLYFLLCLLRAFSKLKVAAWALLSPKAVVHRYFPKKKNNNLILRTSSYPINLSNFVDITSLQKKMKGNKRQFLFNFPVLNKCKEALNCWWTLVELISWAEQWGPLNQEVLWTIWWGIKIFHPS